MTTTAEHIAAIRKALEAGPTPGEWKGVRGGETGFIRGIDASSTVIVRWHGLGSPASKQGQANASLIISCNPVAMTAVLAEIDRLERESARATAEKNGLLEILKNHTGFDHGIMAIRSLVERAEKAEAENKRMREALEPFADIAGEAWADKDGWTEAACQKDRIVDWFGPSAFHNARAALKGDTHGN